MHKPVIILIGTFDTKSDIFNYLYHRFNPNKWEILTINTGTFDTRVDFHIQYDSELVAALGGAELKDLHRNQVRHQAVEVMSSGASRICREIVQNRQVVGAIGA